MQQCSYMFKQIGDKITALSVYLILQMYIDNTIVSQSARKCFNCKLTIILCCGAGVG
jgi:hypothetical protein